MVQTFTSEDKVLDSFLYEKIAVWRFEYAALWELAKEILTLSHGQSSVERGFSENSDILQTNMKGETLVCFRQAVDGSRNRHSPFEESETKNLLNSCRHAHSSKIKVALTESSSHLRCIH